MKTILVIVISCLLIGVGFAFADQVITTLSVPAWQDCQIDGYNLRCNTNAQHVIINDRMIY